MVNFYTQLTRKIGNSIQQACILCGDGGHKNLCLCQACLSELPFIEHGCQTCGLPLPQNINRCGACISIPPPNTSCTSLLHYQEPVDYLIKHMKYHNQLSIAALLGNLLADKIKKTKQPLPQQLIPVPLHFSRLQQRGYNQATEIARAISSVLNIPVNIKGYTRQRNTEPQFDLPPNQRAGNMHQAFQSTQQTQTKHVAIIDDVMTTGSTVWEFSQTIIDSGVERVDIWACARAITTD